MRIFGWVLLPRDEVVDGLRGQVSSLQIKRNRLGERCEKLAARVGALKGQIASDQVYIDALEANVMPADLARIRQQMKDHRASRCSLPSAQTDDLVSEANE